MSALPAPAPPPLPVDLAQLSRHCQSFRGAIASRALFQVTTTLAAYLGLAALVLICHHQGHHLLAAGLTLPAAGMLVRLFIIQHDCGHASFFGSRRANTWTGRVLSLLTFTPYDYWRKSHALHHAASGNLDRRSVGSVDTLTVSEYRALPARARLLYRLFRHPLVLLVIGAPLHTLVLQRFAPVSTVPYLPDYHMIPARQAWPSILGLNLALVVFYGPFIYLLGPTLFLTGYLPVVVGAAWIGGWLFYIQHQFEHTYWQRQGQWNQQEAAIYGSTYYVLPGVLQWFTGNIGLHHLHHFCPLIPNYRLQECLDGAPALKQVGRLSLLQSLRCLHWRLWDETRQTMIGFGDLKQT